VICAAVIGILEFPNSGQDWFLATTLAILAFAGQSFFTQALKYEEAGPVGEIISNSRKNINSQCFPVE